MLTKFTVSNYRGFKDPVTLDLSSPRGYSFNSSHITDGVVTNALVIGANTSGKTNLLRAIADVRRNFYPKAGLYPLEDGRGFLNANSSDEAASFAYEFLFGDSRVTYRYAKDANRNIVQEALLIDDTTVLIATARGSSLIRT